MATTLSRNLRLRINSSLTADAKYNLERLDLLGSTFVVDSTNQLNIRSQTSILIEPNSADIGGTGLGGTVSVGTSDHILTSVSYFSSAFNISAPLSLLDQASGGNKYLQVRYKSDAFGSVDTTANRILSIDPNGADRLFVLGGDFSFTGGSLTLTLSGNTSLTAPLTGTLATLAGSETLTNKTIDALDNTISNLSNSSIAASAGIVYSKLNLASSIVNADISPSAAISYSKLTLTSSITNSDVSGSAAISRSKLGTGSADQVVINAGDGTFSSEAQLAISRGGTGAATANAALNALLPSQAGNSGKVLQTDGSDTSWISFGAGNVSGAGADWVSGDGTTKVVSHGLGSTDVDVTIVDLSDNQLIGISSIVVTDSNTLTLTASEAPSSTWRVIVLAN